MTKVKVFVQSYWQAIIAVLFLLAGIFLYVQWSRSLEDIGRFKAQYEQLQADKKVLETQKAATDASLAALKDEIAQREKTVALLSKQVATNNAKIASAEKALQTVEKAHDEKVNSIRFSPPDAVFDEVQRLLRAIPDP